MRQVVRLTLPPVTQDTAVEPAKSMLDKVQKKNGFIHNMDANMANSPGLLVTYLTGYKWFQEHSGFTPTEQEVVFLTISLDHACDYCMLAHSMIADKVSKMSSSVLEAIRPVSPFPMRSWLHCLFSRGPCSTNANRFILKM